MGISFYKNLVEKCDCSIVETQSTMYTGRYSSTTRFGFRSVSDGKILIGAITNKYKKEGILIHEMGHRRCHMRNCMCFVKWNRVLIEVHAELYALHYLLKNHRKMALATRIRRLQSAGWNISHYREARDIIRKRRIYKRCEDFVAKRKIRNLTIIKKSKTLNSESE